MRRIGILTAGGDTPALNATIFGAVERANQLKMEVFGIVKGFAGLLDGRVPHVPLNPLYSRIPELDPCLGGTLLGASRTYIHSDRPDELKTVAGRLDRLGIEGIICIGGDGTINGMQPISECFPCVLAPKTIDNDLGLNYIDEPNDWVRETDPKTGKTTSRLRITHDAVDLDEIINYATPGYATAVLVATQSIQRIRTTAESHRRIAIIELMGRESGYISLGSAYGQPDIILVPEFPIDREHLIQRVCQLYELQKHVVIAVGEGVVDETGQQLGAITPSFDPAGNVQFSGAGEELKRILVKSLGDSYFRDRKRHDDANSAVFTRKVGHTQRGGRPILFDRFHAIQLGGKAVDMLHQGQTNAVATLQWSQDHGFRVDSIAANKLRDQWGAIHPRSLHPSMYDPRRFQPSDLGVRYLQTIFSKAIGWDDLEHQRTDLFSPGNLSTRYQSVNVDVQKRMRFLGE